MNPAIGLAKRLGPEEPQLSSLGGTPDFWKYQRWSSQTRCAFDQIKATPPTVQNRDLGKKTARILTGTAGSGEKHALVGAGARDLERGNCRNVLT